MTPSHFSVANRSGIVTSMPAWTPNWNPVEIDELSLLDAIADCQAAISLIEDGHVSLQPFVAAAREHWEGPARLDFDEDFANFEHQLASTVSQLRQAALAYQREIAEAHEEQARRTAQQEQWRRESVEEQARAEAMAEAAARQPTSRPFTLKLPAGPPAPASAAANPSWSEVDWSG